MLNGTFLSRMYDVRVRKQRLVHSKTNGSRMFEHLDHPTLAVFQIQVEPGQQIFLHSNNRNLIRNRQFLEDMSYVRTILPYRIYLSYRMVQYGRTYEAHARILPYGLHLSYRMVQYVRKYWASHVHRMLFLFAWFCFQSLAWTTARRHSQLYLKT